MCFIKPDILSNTLFKDDSPVAHPHYSYAIKTNKETHALIQA